MVKPHYVGALLQYGEASLCRSLISVWRILIMLELYYCRSEPYYSMANPHYVGALLQYGEASLCRSLITVCRSLITVWQSLIMSEPYYSMSKLHYVGALKIFCRSLITSEPYYSMLKPHYVGALLQYICRSFVMLKPHYVEASLCWSLIMSKPQYVEGKLCTTVYWSIQIITVSAWVGNQIIGCRWSTHDITSFYVQYLFNIPSIRPFYMFCLTMSISWYRFKIVIKI